MSETPNTTSNSAIVDQPGPACNRVLVAEDDAMFRRILRSWLESWGYEVMIAEDGARAWELLQLEPAPHMVILDWIMPELNGIDLCRLIRERDQSPYQYLLLVTAKDDTEDLIAGLESGADDYLSKPFNKYELRARLRTGRRILTLQDEHLKARAELQHQATHDGLTGVWNRKTILSLLDRELNLGVRSNQTTGILMLDLDHFKSVNDTYGHLAGDAVLRESVRRIQEALRTSDLIGRYGGEEFLVVLSNCAPDQIESCAERLRAAIAAGPVLAGQIAIPVTVSIGASIAQRTLQSTDDAIASADAALYRAKKSGRNRVVSAVSQALPQAERPIAEVGVPKVDFAKTA